MSEYQGWTNWHTWNTNAIADNEQDTHEAMRDIVARGGSEEDLRDYLIKVVLGPNNARAIEDAQEWNAIPEDERIDPHYEDLKERSPQAAELADALGFGANVSDEEPDLIDPELVNWNEIYQRLVDEANQNSEYEAEQEANSQRWDYFTTGQGDHYNSMYDAYIKSLIPDSVPDDASWRDSAEYNTVLKPIDQLNPEDYAGGIEGEYWQNNIAPNGGSRVWLRDMAADAIGPIIRGQASPEALQTMQTALQAQGYTPEQIEDYTRQRLEQDPEGKWRIVEGLDEAPAPDPTLDQPGDLTMPSHWSSVHSWFKGKGFFSGNR